MYGLKPKYSMVKRTPVARSLEVCAWLNFQAQVSPAILVC